MLTVLEATATRRFALRRGAVDTRVRKLVPGERFIIETADAEVEVHGTRFRVELGAPESVPCSGVGPKAVIATRVTVTSGVVSVKWSGDEQRLLPGDIWPPRCAAATTVAREAQVETVSPGRGVHRRSTLAAETRHLPPSSGVSVSAARAPRREPAASVLEAQNDLFVSAVRARRAGKSSLALGLLDRFIHDYPDASLFESALVQKMRLLAATSDLSDAAALAHQYLERFPDGFARDEARTLIGAPSPR